MTINGEDHTYFEPEDEWGEIRDFDFHTYNSYLKKHYLHRARVQVTDFGDSALVLVLTYPDSVRSDYFPDYHQIFMEGEGITHEEVKSTVLRDFDALEAEGGEM